MADNGGPVGKAPVVRYHSGAHEGAHSVGDRDARPILARQSHLPTKLSVAEVLVGLATDTTVYLSLWGGALKVTILTFTILISESSLHPGLPGHPLFLEARDPSSPDNLTCRRNCFTTKSKVIVQSTSLTPRPNRFTRALPPRGSRDPLRLADGGALPYQGARHCPGFETRDPSSPYNLTCQPNCFYDAV